VRTEKLKAGDLPGLTLTAYADRFHVRPGDTVRFMVNCDGPKTFRADIVQLRCGDTNPAGPGFKETLVKTPTNRRYKGRRQKIHAGSCVRIDDPTNLDGLESFTLQAMVWPTTPARGEQGLIGRWSDAKRWYSAPILPVSEIGHPPRRPTKPMQRSAISAPVEEMRCCYR
jgi:hypothetical protein